MVAAGAKLGSRVAGAVPVDAPGVLTHTFHISRATERAGLSESRLGCGFTGSCACAEHSANCPLSPFAASEDCTLYNAMLPANLVSP